MGCTSENCICVWKKRGVQEHVCMHMPICETMGLWICICASVLAWDVMAESSPRVRCLPVVKESSKTNLQGPLEVIYL